MRTTSPSDLAPIMEDVVNAATLMDHWVSLLVVVMLLSDLGLVSGSEVAFFSLSPQSLSELEEDDSTGASRVLALMRTPNNTEARETCSGPFWW